MKNLHERAVEAAIRFVERKGYEVLDRNWSYEGIAGRLDLVTMDEDAIVFIDVTAANREEGGFSEGNLTREQFELLAATWLEGYTPEGDVPVRFDGIDMIVVNSGTTSTSWARSRSPSRSGRPPETGGAAAGGSSLSVLPTRRGTSAARDPPSRSRAARTPAPSRHGFPTRLRRLRNAAWPFLRESPPKGATSRMGLRAPCPRPRGTPPWESHARPPSRTGSQRSGAAGLSRARPRLRRPHDIPAKPGERPCGNRVWRRWRLSPS